MEKNIAHMLNAIVLEIAIKVIWEIDNNRDCRFTHNIRELYEELADNSKRDISEIYEKKSALLAALEGTGRQGQRIRLGDLVEFQSLQDALEANADTMRNFKYDGEYNGKSSTMGSAIWNDGLLYTMPPLNEERIPEALYRYTLGRLERANIGRA